MEGLSLREFFLRGLQLAIQSPSEQASRPQVSFPLIRTPQASTRLTDEMVAEALNTDEDLI